MNMLDYFTGKINKHDDINLVLEDGHYASKEEYEKRKKYINKQFNNSNVWRLVISLNKDFVEYNIQWQDLEKKLAKEIIPKFLKRMGFEDPKKMCYQFSLHMNTKHPHFHVAFMEKKPNTKGYDNKLQYRRIGKIPNSCINYLMNELILCIEREKYFRPLSIGISNDIVDLKKYFNPKDKNFVLYDKKNILLEEKILLLGKKLNELHKNDNSIKYGSIKNLEVQRLTIEIRNELFDRKDIGITRSNFNKSIMDMNNYLKEITKINNIKADLSYTSNKKNYLENYISNAIINYANNHYKTEKNKVIDSNDILNAIILNIYKKNDYITKKKIVKNSFNKKYVCTSEMINAIKNINKELEEAAQKFFIINQKGRNM